MSSKLTASGLEKARMVGAETSSVSQKNQFVLTVWCLAGTHRTHPARRTQVPHDDAAPAQELKTFFHQSKKQTKKKLIHMNSICMKNQVPARQP